jgi:hypothetical protein
LIIEALGDVEDDENIYHQLLTNCVMDAFLSFGVSEDTIHTIFDIDIEAADDAIEAATATIIANMPHDGESLENFEREFIYGIHLKQMKRKVLMLQLVKNYPMARQRKNRWWS